MGECNVNLAALIGSRICHDLISPIGAINNGLELLDMNGGVQGPEMELISGSVRNAGARIRFFRIAFGSFSEHPLSPTEVKAILDDVGQNGRLKVHWELTDRKSRNEVKLAFLAIQCCESAMPPGGEIAFSCENDQWLIAGVADKLNVDGELWQGLSTGSCRKQITPAHVQFALLPEAARCLDRNLRAETSSTVLTIRF